MEEQNTTPEIVQENLSSRLNQVTPFSKYLAMALFVLLPFVGGYVGYTFAPEKVVEVVKESVVGVEEYLEGLGGSNEKSAPYTDPDLIIFPKDKSAIEEIVIEDAVIYAGLKTGGWVEAGIANPDDIEYVGYGLYKDGGELRALPRMLNNEENLNKLNPKKDIALTEQVFVKDDRETTLVFLDNEDELFLLIHPGFSLSPDIFEAPVTEIGKLTDLGRGYYADGQKVLYITGIPFSAYFFLLENVTPERFVVDDKLNIGISGENVYHHGKLLEGLAFSQMDSSQIGVLRDGDTVYLLQGNCNQIEYELATFADLETYQPPC